MVAILLSKQIVAHALVLLAPCGLGSRITYLIVTSESQLTTLNLSGTLPV